MKVGEFCIHLHASLLLVSFVLSFLVVVLIAQSSLCSVLLLSSCRALLSIKKGEVIAQQIFLREEKEKKMKKEEIPVVNLW